MNSKIIDSLALNTLVNKSNLVGAEIGVGTGINALSILENLDIKRLYLIDPYADFFTVVSESDRIDKNGVVKTSRRIVFNNMKYPHIHIDSNSFCKEGAIETVKEYSDKIIWIYDISSEAVNKIYDNELDFVYIDGNHKYEYVKQDIILYRDKVKKGGLVSGHDFDRDYVEKAVREVVKENIYYGKSNSRANLDWWYIKV